MSILEPLFGKNPKSISIIMTVIAALATAAWVFLFFHQFPIPPSSLELLLILLVAADLGGGIVANGTAETSTWYAQRSMFVRLGFVTMHAIYPAIIVIFFSVDTNIGIILFAVMAISSSIVMLADKFSVPQLPLAGLLFTLALGTAYTLPGFPTLMLWFPPLYFLKLIVMYPINHAKTNSNAASLRGAIKSN